MFFSLFFFALLLSVSTIALKLNNWNDGMVSMKYGILLKWKLNLLLFLSLALSLSLFHFAHTHVPTPSYTWGNISIKSNFKMEMLLCPLFVCLFCLRGFFFSRNFIYNHSYFSGIFITPWFSPLPSYVCIRRSSNYEPFLELWKIWFHE